MGARHLRLFVAVDVQGEEERAKIREIQQKISSCGADVKLVEPENLHVTLKFLGRTDPGRVEVVAETLERAVSGFEPFTAELRGVGAFPSPG
ncbi:MAG: RNA 2',3'-cyclic phosphodiesterase, partial [Thermoproteota archaeon]